MPERVLALQLVAIFALVAAHVATKLLHVLGGHDQVFGLSALLDLEREINIPSFYSMLIVLIDAALLALIGMLYRAQKRPDTWYWFFLAATFVFLAADEAFGIHEQATSAVRDLLGNKRAAHVNFAAIGAVFTFIVLVPSIRFLIRLDRRTSLLMIASGAVFVAGALGFEILQGLRFEAQGFEVLQQGHERLRSARLHPDPLYLSLVTVEETLEMLGMALFSYALVDHLRTQFGDVTIRLG